MNMAGFFASVYQKAAPAGAALVGAGAGAGGRGFEEAAWAKTTSTFSNWRAS